MILKALKIYFNYLKIVLLKEYFSLHPLEVYGEPVELHKMKIQHLLGPRVPYAVVKNVGEAFFKSFHKSYGLPLLFFDSLIHTDLIKVKTL